MKSNENANNGSASIPDSPIDAMPMQRYELRRSSSGLYHLRLLEPSIESAGGDSVSVATMKIGGSAGWVAINRKCYSVQREPGWGDFVLHNDGVETARATKGGAFSWRFDIQTPNTQFTLKNASSFSSNFVSRHFDQPVFAMCKRGFWSTRGEITVESTVPITLLAFQAWLAMLMWKTADDSAGIVHVSG